MSGDVESMSMTPPIEIRRIVTLCTGNAARSVMLGYMLTALSDAHGASWSVRTAGTHVVEGQAISPRTLEALRGIGELGDQPFTTHRSHQLTDDDVRWADLIVGVEASHVIYVRTNHPEASGRVVHLREFVRHAPLDSPPVEQIRVVAALDPGRDLDVPDPAGGDQLAYNLCAAELWELSQVFATLLRVDEIG